MLVRLEHFFPPGEGPSFYYLPVTVSLKKLLSNDGYGLGKVIGVNETALGANQWKDSNINGADFEVTIQPFEIRSFIVHIEIEMEFNPKIQITWTICD